MLIFELPQIHANCRLRRCYFADRIYTEEELPAEFKLFLPIAEEQETPIEQQKIDVDLDDAAGPSKKFIKPSAAD